MFELLDKLPRMREVFSDALSACHTFSRELDLEDDNANRFFFLQHLMIFTCYSMMQGCTS